MGTHDVAVSVTVPLEPHGAFDLFAIGIGEWWRDYWNEPSDRGTQVTLGHRGWGGLSEPNAGEGYDSGWEELLGWYAQAAAARGTG